MSDTVKNLKPFHDKDYDLFPEYSKDFLFVDACPAPESGGKGTPLWIVKPELNLWDHQKNSGFSNNFLICVLLGST